MNKEKLTTGKYHYCPFCRGLNSDNFKGEDGKIECRQIIAKGNRYYFCGAIYHASTYNAFIWDEENANFKKDIPVRNWR